MSIPTAILFALVVVPAQTATGPADTAPLVSAPAASAPAAREPAAESGEPVVDEAAPSTTTKPSSTSKSERVRALVLSPATTGADQATADAIASVIAVHLTGYRELDVVTASDIARIAELEAEKQAVGCSTTSCLAEIAGAMGARLVVFSELSRLGSLLVVNLSLFDSDKGSAIERVSVRVRSVEVLPERLAPAVDQLVVRFLVQEGRRDTAALAALAPIESDSGPAEVAPAPIEESSTVLPWTLAGVGLTVGALASVTALVVAVVPYLMAASALGTASTTHDRQEYEEAQQQFQNAQQLEAPLVATAGVIGGLGLVALVGGGVGVVWALGSGE